MTAARFSLSGGLAGAVSAVVFVWVHDIFISDIWFSLVLMMFAGAICGLCIAGTYGLMASRFSVWGWLGYNGIYVGLLGLLGLVSVLVFEPVTTIAALVAVNGPPEQLIGQAMPVTVFFTLGMAVLIGRLYARRWIHFGAVLLTCFVVVLLLGLNVSVIGLVEVPRSSLYLILELFGLILALNVVFAAVFMFLERKVMYGIGP